MSFLGMYFFNEILLFLSIRLSVCAQTQSPENDIANAVSISEINGGKIHEFDKYTDAFPISINVIMTVSAIAFFIILLASPMMIENTQTKAETCRQIMLADFTDSVKEYFCRKLKSNSFDFDLFIPNSIPQVMLDKSIDE